MRYLSVCSGIEAATVAWHPLEWKAAAYSEIEKFPSQVLAHHYPNTPNVGDMTKFKEWTNVSDVDVLVGGTPCQSFSVAGLRKGLDDPRGNLMLTYLAIAAKYRPKWLVWENVPGVLSSNGGLDFASLLRGMGELGYGFAYRILDAQYFGVAQRRRRVFVVGYAGNWRPAAAVLFERHSMCGYPAPSREKGEDSAPTVTSGAPFSRTENDRVEADAMVAVLHSEISPALKARDHKGPSSDGDGDGAILVPMQPIAFDAYNQTTSDTVTALRCAAGGVFDNTVAQPIALAENTIGRKPENGGNGDGFTENGPIYTLNATGVHGVMQPIAYALDSLASNSMKSANPASGCNAVDVSKALDTSRGLDPSCNQGGMAVAQPIGIFQDSEYGVAQYDNAGTLRAGRIPEHQMVMQPIPFDTTQITSKANGSNPQSGDPCHPLAAGAHAPAITQPMAICLGGQHPNAGIGIDQSPTLTNAMGAGGGHIPITNAMHQGGAAIVQPVHCVDMGANKGLNGGGILKELSQPLGTNESHAIQQAMAVRRLTPIECERLQGFPDNYTDIKSKNKPTPDGPRYKALGNSMAVPVMAWIGRRIQEVETLLPQRLESTSPKKNP